MPTWLPAPAVIYEKNVIYAVSRQGGLNEIAGRGGPAMTRVLQSPGRSACALRPG
jgi:hypothetical protein